MARKARGLLLLLATAVLAPCLALSARPPCGSIDALRSGRALLVEAAKNDDVDTVKRHITEKKDLFFAIEQAKCRTLFHFAARAGSTHVLEALHQSTNGRGRMAALVNHKDNEGHSPLWVACTEGKTDAVKTLLGLGADPATAPPGDCVDVDDDGDIDLNDVVASSYRGWAGPKTIVASDLTPGGDGGGDGDGDDGGVGDGGADTDASTAQQSVVGWWWTTGAILVVGVVAVYANGLLPPHAALLFGLFVICSFLAAWEVHTHGLGDGLDLSGDGLVDGSDAAFPLMHISPGAFFDVTGDGSFTLRDALIVVLTVAVVVVAFRSGYDAEEAARQRERADMLEERLERQRRVAEDRLDRWVIAQQARDALEREITQLEDQLQQGQDKASGADERIDELRRQLDKAKAVEKARGIKLKQAHEARRKAEKGRDDAEYARKRAAEQARVDQNRVAAAQRNCDTLEREVSQLKLRFEAQDVDEGIAELRRDLNEAEGKLNEAEALRNAEVDVQEQHEEEAATAAADAKSGKEKTEKTENMGTPSPLMRKGGGTIDAPNLRESELMPDEDDGGFVADTDAAVAKAKAARRAAEGKTNTTAPPSG